MAKNRKVIRTTYLYKKNNSFGKKTISFLLFGLILAGLTGLGFIVSKEWTLRFGENADIISSSDITSSNINSSQVISSTNEKPEVTKDAIISTQMNLEILKSSTESINKFLQEAKNNGYNTISIPVKTEDGLLHYKTDNAMAKKYGAISEKTVDISNITKMISDMKLKSLLVVSALKDPVAPHVRNSNSYAFSKMLDVNWLDNSPNLGGKPWLNPYMDNTRVYLKDISSELSKSGADYIMLTNVIFPEQYTTNLNVINETTTREGILKQVQDDIKKSVLETTNIITQVDLFKMATQSDKGLISNIKSSGNDKLSFLIEVNVFEQSKKDVFEKSNIFGEKDFDENISAIKIIQELITAIKKIENIEFLLVMNQSDFKALEPVLKSLEIIDYIII